MKDLLVTVVAGIVFLVLAAIDWSGAQFFIQKKYRTHPQLRTWQMRNAALETAFGLCGIALYFVKGRVPLLILGIIAIAALLLMGVNVRGQRI